MCGFRPLLKLCAQTHALIIVMIIRIMVMTAKKDSDRLAGRYCSARAGEYIRTSLKRKYARPPK